MKYTWAVIWFLSFAFYSRDETKLFFYMKALSATNILMKFNEIAINNP